MNENKFNYIVGVLLIVLLVVVVYVGGKVNMLEDDVASLSNRVDAIKAVTLGNGSVADDNLGYDNSGDNTASVYDSYNNDAQSYDYTDAVQ